MIVSKLKMGALLSIALCALTAHAKVVDITSEDDFNKKVIHGNKPAVVKFSAKWCGYCKFAKNPFKEVAEEPEFSYVLFAHVDTDKAQDITGMYEVNGLPTFVFFENGAQKDRGEGVSSQDPEQFKENLRNQIRKNFKQAKTQKSKTVDKTQKPRKAKNQ